MHTRAAPKKKDGTEIPPPSPMYNPLPNSATAAHRKGIARWAEEARSGMRQKVLAIRAVLMAI
jgi:hypothetical protein